MCGDYYVAKIYSHGVATATAAAVAAGTADVGDTLVSLSRLFILVSYLHAVYVHRCAKASSTLVCLA